MDKTIGNPLSWLAHTFGHGSRYVESSAREFGALDTAPIETRRIGLSDLTLALHKGTEDFSALRTDVIFVVLMYPIIGFVLAWFAFNNALMPLIFPMASGFALLGPFAAVGLYEMSRRREMGLETGWGDAFGVIESPSFVPIVTLGGYLVATFFVWMVFSYFIYILAFGAEPPVSASAFVQDLFSTKAGIWMQVVSIGIGAVVAVIVLAVSFIAFPMMVDRHVGLTRAVLTSVDVAIKNPITTLAWGAIVVGLLAVGVLTLFVGLIVFLPILGHATWHLYRRAVVAPTS